MTVAFVTVDGTSGVSDGGFLLQIPDDSIAKDCNRMTVFLKNLQPDRYRLASNTKGGRFESFVYADNDGGDFGDNIIGYDSLDHIVGEDSPVVIHENCTE